MRGIGDTPTGSCRVDVVLFMVVSNKNIFVTFWPSIIFLQNFPIKGRRPVGTVAARTLRMTTSIAEATD